ncbi:hypothetical protein AVEN_148109-1 [Araneus ventricosus]|uniref:Uncharacterized protein n=1 Tax=Araneus ventricosus TaxID=182803 RepID=A0A4Y2WWT1_ARAVE|nr:hypothetical protein AVEN_148109-1 [Araneus ventricosus]
MYRRHDNANHATINGTFVDNRWIVPYNPYLTKKYNAHINVEICSSIKSKKNIFKYVYKGHDCAKGVFESNGQGSITWDEIKTFLDARYVSATEAMWRLLEKKCTINLMLSFVYQCICPTCRWCISMMMKNVKHWKELLK